MASTIRVSCASCGTAEVPIADAWLLLGLGSGAAGNAVEYTCPRCGQVRRHPVDERGTRLLTAAGITLVYPDALSSPHERGEAAADEAARMQPSWPHPRRSPGSC